LDVSSLQNSFITIVPNFMLFMLCIKGGKRWQMDTSQYVLSSWHDFLSWVGKMHDILESWVSFKELFFVLNNCKIQLLHGSNLRKLMNSWLLEWFFCAWVLCSPLVNGGSSSSFSIYHAIMIQSYLCWWCTITTKKCVLVHFGFR
jgi:hypothetical protein